MALGCVGIEDALASSEQGAQDVVFVGGVGEAGGIDGGADSGLGDLGHLAGHPAGVVVGEGVEGGMGQVGSPGGWIKVGVESADGGRNDGLVGVVAVAWGLGAEPAAAGPEQVGAAASALPGLLGLPVPGAQGAVEVDGERVEAAWEKLSDEGPWRIKVGEKTYSIKEQSPSDYNPSVEKDKVSEK